MAKRYLFLIVILISTAMSAQLSESEIAMENKIDKLISQLTIKEEIDQML